jgi:hypothetical protein
MIYARLMIMSDITDNTGWIKLHRKFIKWEWWDDHSTTRLFLFLLCSVNHEDKKWQGKIIKRGEIATGRRTLAKQTGLSEQSVRTSIERLKSTSEITSINYSKYSIISITNYEKYQASNQQSNQHLTSNQPASNQQVTTTKELKNLRTKEYKNISKDIYIVDFENFYFLYPNKKGKQKATEAYLRARKTVDAETIIAGLNAYKKECELLGREQRFIKHPATWLNAASWVDEYQTITENNNGTNSREGFNKGGVFGRKSQSEEIAAGIERIKQDYRNGNF